MPEPLMQIRISIPLQELCLFADDGACIRRYRISTAAKGAGERSGSNCTPRGRHVIRARIGTGLPLGAVFRARRPTGETCTPELQAVFPGRDWITTRILWLSGCERGFNRLGAVDTMRRYIYIHGTPDRAVLGTPASHGCIRMADEDVAELFELVVVGTPVQIEEGADDGQR
jgi:L,D-transpeptidase YbiS